MSRLKHLIHEIHRRSLWQVLGIYVVGAWIGYEVIQGLTEGMGLPSWFPSLAVVLFIIGLPIVLATAFVQEGVGRRQPAAPVGEVETTTGGTPIPPAHGTGQPPVGTGARRLFTWRNAILGGVVAIALWGIVATVWLVVGGPRERTTSAEADGIPVDQSVVAVLPFRVSGADQEVAFLREGMVDALAQTLTGEGGPRAVDPRAVISAWRRAVSSPSDDLSDDAAIGVGRNLGAGLVLLGGVIGTADNLILNASLVETETGNNRARASVDGPADSLTSLVNQLTAALLVQQPTGQYAAPSNLGDVSLPVIRLYVQGQSAYRDGQYESAANLFERALTLDSTFVPAAVGLRMAASWFSASALRQRQLSEPIAWAGRERLSPADRAVLLALIGDTYPNPSSTTRRLEVLNRSVQTAPDRPEVWYELGDLYFHYGRLIGIREPFARAHAAFSRAVALDSSFSAALEHLMDVAAVQEDTAALRAISRHYFELHTNTDVVDYYRWRVAMVLGDTLALREVRGRFGEISSPSLWRIIGYSQVLGVDMQDAHRAVRELRSRPASPAELESNLFVLDAYALNTGQPDLAAEILAEASPGGDLSGAGLVLLAAAGYWDADTAVAADLVGRVMRMEGDDGSAGTPIGCILGVWYLSRNDLEAASEAVAALEAASTETVPSSPSVSANCRSGIEAVILVRSAMITRPEAIGRLEEVILSRASAELITWIYGAPLVLELSRLYEQEGDYQRALETVRRRVFGWSSDAAFLSSLLREEGRLAALAGDREAAIAAYRHYLTLRSDPEPVLADQVDGIRAELARLEAEGSRSAG